MSIINSLDQLVESNLRSVHEFLKPGESLIDYTHWEDSCVFLILSLNNDELSNTERKRIMALQDQLFEFGFTCELQRQFNYPENPLGLKITRIEGLTIASDFKQLNDLFMQNDRSSLLSSSNESTTVTSYN